MGKKWLSHVYRLESQQSDNAGVVDTYQGAMSDWIKQNINGKLTIDQFLQLATEFKDAQEDPDACADDIRDYCQRVIEKLAEGDMKTEEFMKESQTGV